MNKLLFTTLLLISTCLQGDEKEVSFLKVNSKRLIRVVGVVDSSIKKEANKLLQLVNKNKKPVDIVIESPGGFVTPGLQFIDAMKMAQNRGVVLRCIVPTYAASMAFIILAHCDERYSLPSAGLLFHPMGFSCFLCRLTMDTLQYRLLRMEALGKGIDERLLSAMGMDEGIYLYHKFHGTLWLAQELSEVTVDFIEIVKDIRGLRNMFHLGRK